VILCVIHDTADLDVDQNSHTQFKDDLNVISFRKGNKIGVYISVTPLKSGEKCSVYFKMRHDFVNTVIQTHGSVDRQPQISWITHKITLNLGTVSQ